MLGILFLYLEPQMMFLHSHLFYNCCSNSRNPFFSFLFFFLGGGDLSLVYAGLHGYNLRLGASLIVGKVPAIVSQSSSIEYWRVFPVYIWTLVILFSGC